MNKKTTIEVNDHLYTWNDKVVSVKPYSKKYDLYGDEVIIGIEESAIEFMKLAHLDASRRKDWAKQ